jgi:putative iron-dependent peroxidase
VPPGQPGAGGTFAFIQLFILNKTALDEAPQAMLENMIGRESTHTEALARPREHCHIKRARVINTMDGTNTELLRQSFPFFYKNKFKGGRDAVSDGILFLAFGKSAQRFSEILLNIFGEDRKYKDRSVRFTDDLFLSNVDGV